jgi:hypothetical protein
MRRRTLLASILACAAAACARPVPRPARAALDEGGPEFERWNREATAILSDAHETLQTFEVFTAFRVAMAEQSERRSATELAWDPPSGAAWDEAIHVSKGMHGRTEQLFLAVSAAQLDPGRWRQQRDLADATHDLIELGDALGAYLTRVERLTPRSDGTEAWPLLDGAWQRWDANAARWGVSRAELIGCATS